MAIKYQICTYDDCQLHQGDIFRNVRYYEKFSEIQGRFELSVLGFPYSIVLSQECDLDNNCKERKGLPKDCTQMILHDKFMVSLLCAPLYNAEHLFGGNHLSELNIQSESKNSKQKDYIKSNRDPRYHFIEFDNSAQIVPMVIDFKHFFTVPIAELEESLKNRVCSLQPLFREFITQRFANFMSRIGLPESKKS